MSPSSKPRILIPACNRQLGEHAFHTVGKKYADAARLAGGLPLLLPNLQADEIEAALDDADGILLTGSPANVHPDRFGEALLDPTLPLDPVRDQTTLALIPALLARGLPLFAICRGMQEVNVALGGTLHQAVHDVGPYRDHREDEQAPVEQQYEAAHEVSVQPGGVLETLFGRISFAVNSLHGQGVARLAPRLRIEALAPDGIIEAASVTDYESFSLCVQWHPEWRAAENAISVRLLHAFGEACSSYRDRRLRRSC